MKNEHRTMSDFEQKRSELRRRHEELLTRKNIPLMQDNGIYTKYTWISNRIPCYTLHKSP